MAKKTAKPVKKTPIKTESKSVKPKLVKKQAAVKAAPAKTSKKATPAKVAPAKTAPVKAAPAKAKPVSAKPVKAAPGKKTSPVKNIKEAVKKTAPANKAKKIIPAQAKPKAIIKKAETPKKVKETKIKVKIEKEKEPKILKVVNAVKELKKPVKSAKSKLPEIKSGLKILKSSHKPRIKEEEDEEIVIKKVKPTFKKKDIEKLRAMLTSESIRLQAEVEQLEQVSKTKSDHEEGNQDLPGYSIHLAEYATDSSIIETALMTRHIIEKRLRQVNDALLRLTREEYGICLRCGCAIAVERLMIKPFAEYCIDCRKIIEALNRR